MSLPPGFDQYRIETLLGEGRFALTYRAIDTVRRRVVALKLLRPELLTGVSAGGESLSEQARPASELIHPHIAWLWEAVQSGETCYLAERYASGPNLALALNRSGPLDWPQARQALGQLIQGLEFAHARGWVHGDIHPGNIILSPELGAVLTDFALTRLARFQPEAQQPFATDDQHAGWSLYQAPEVRLGDPATPASDQYSLACALLEMLTGQPLSASPEKAGLEAENASAAPDELSESGAALLAGGPTAPAAPDPLAAPAFPPAWPPGAPAGLAAVLQRALALEPAERYASPGAFLEALDTLHLAPPDEAILQAWRSQQLNSRRSAEDQERRRVEDTARLAALEQARREIAAQLGQPASSGQSPSLVGEKPVAAAPAGSLVDRKTTTTAAGGVKPTSATAAGAATARRRSARRAAARRLWPLWVGLLALALALGGFWLDSRLPLSLIFPPSPTPTVLTATPTLPPPSATASPTATATATLTPTLTATFTATWTATPTLTPSPTMTVTSTSTPEPTATPRPTATRTRRVDRDG